MSSELAESGHRYRFLLVFRGQPLEYIIYRAMLYTFSSHKIIFLRDYLARHHVRHKLLVALLHLLL